MSLPKISKIEQRGQNREIVLVFEQPYDLEELTNHCCDYLSTAYGDAFYSRKYEDRRFLKGNFSEIYVFENKLDQKVTLFKGDPGTYINGVGYDLQVNAERTMCRPLSPNYIRSNKLEEWDSWMELQEPLPLWCKLEYLNYDEDYPQFIFTFQNGLEALRGYCLQKSRN